ncbi:MAG: hypothetical protein D4S01_05830 [Dehalococcoidia bacterium]|nr:MAG: hypothetical protein D4S01_05830 [Dehalococcoidia bacterium]
MRKIGIVGILLITVLLVLGACTPAPEPAPTPEDSLTAPRLLSPHHEATDVQLSPTLLWELVPDAGGYELAISPNYDFSNILHKESTQLTAYRITEDLTPSTRYYWMVCAKLNPADPDTPTACSEVWTFTTAEQPAPEPEPTPPLEPPSSPEPIKITAAQLSTEYDEIGLAAETQYKNQILEVSGTFDYFGSAVGSPFISFEVDEDAWEIRAFLADDQISQAETLSKGDEIVVIGTCRGSTVISIILGECRIVP